MGPVTADPVGSREVQANGFATKSPDTEYAPAVEFPAHSAQAVLVDANTAGRTQSETVSGTLILGT
jgi:hypothetical protein